MASVLLLLVGFLVFAGEIMAMGSNLHGNEEMEIQEQELMGLFEVMDALLEDPDWAQAHPQPCTDTPWPGVECEISNDPPIFHVTKIHIGPDIVSQPCKSSAYLSESLLKLPYLKTLSIFNCFVASSVTIPSTLFGPFSSLEHLALLSNPFLSGELPLSLGQVSSLRVLSLSQNNLKGKIPKQIGGLACLEQLDLSYNNFSGQIPQEIGGLKSITILDLSWNGIEGNLPDSLGQLQLLQKIDLGSNKLTGKIPSDLRKLRRLVLLDVSHNLITGPIPETLSSLELLEYLVIDGNPIEAEIPMFIGSLKNMKSVSFSGCELIGPIPSSLFSSLKNLTALSLDDNSLTGPVPSNLGSLPNLDQLNLSHNKLSGALKFPDEFIGRLGERMDLRGNSELCSTNELNKKNLSSYLEIPACLNTAPRDGDPLGDEPTQDSAGIKPPWYNSNFSSSSSCLDLQVIFFCLGLSFVSCVLHFHL